jgi:hypothetical protein
MQTQREFEHLAQGFLERHPELKFQWSTIENIAGGRTDLLIRPGEASEVFASLTDAQITIGTRTQARDFEAFGRNITPEELAAEALEYLETLVVERT